MLLSSSKKNHQLHHRRRSRESDHRLALTTMAITEVAQERKSPTKLSLFVGSLTESFSSSSTEFFPRSPTPRSPRNFDDGVVGLGIVAAMNESPARSAAPTRSGPIPIVSARIRAKPWREPEEEEEKNMEEEMEMDMMSESYTCVISHVGGKSVRKRVYLDDGGGVAGSYCGCSEMFFASPPPVKPVLPAMDFLSRCYLCRKKLQGLDIFMYRGDKAFCSAECRCKQIMSDELREKCGSDALKPFDCSLSPCSSPLIFAAGVAAA